MISVSTLEFRRHTRSILELVRRGERIVVTYRGKPFAKLEPLEGTGQDDDPFYDLADLATDDGESMTNADVDGAVYGP